MTGFNDTTSILAFLKTRKSGSAKTMGEPGPSPVQLRELLDVAVRVPDHGKLTPWRFIIFEGDARARIGEAFRARWAKLHPEHGSGTLDFVGGMFLRAPMIIAVVSRAGPHMKIPEWEQQMSAGAVCYNIVLAALAMGYAAQWQTDWIAYDEEIKAAMGLASGENIAGFVYVGSGTAPLEERPRPDPMSLVTRWGA